MLEVIRLKIRDIIIIKLDVLYIYIGRKLDVFINSYLIYLIKLYTIHSNIFIFCLIKDHLIFNYIFKIINLEMIFNLLDDI